MDLHRLIYFVTTGKLFFSPLAYFDDPLEGISEDVLFGEEENDQTRNSTDDGEQTPFYTPHLEKIQRTLFASCWFLGARESLAMWETYSNSDSIALRFPPQHLCDVVANNFAALDEPDFEVMVHGKVEYFKLSPFDPSDEAIKNCQHKYSGFLKDISYKHEEEFRFLLMRSYETDGTGFFEFCPGPLREMDFTVITHPNMEHWKFKNICNILKNIGLDERLVKSQIPTRKQMMDSRSR